MESCFPLIDKFFCRTLPVAVNVSKVNSDPLGPNELL